MSEPTIRREDYPPPGLRGMAAAGSHWLLVMIDRNELTAYEALYVVNHMMETVVNLIGREEARLEKRRTARKARKLASDTKE